MVVPHLEIFPGEPLPCTYLIIKPTLYICTTLHTSSFITIYSNSFLFLPLQHPLIFLTTISITKYTLPTNDLSHTFILTTSHTQYQHIYPYLIHSNMLSLILCTYIPYIRLSLMIPYQPLTSFSHNVLASHYTTPISSSAV